MSKKPTVPIATITTNYGSGSQDNSVKYKKTEPRNYPRKPGPIPPPKMEVKPENIISTNFGLGAIKPTPTVTKSNFQKVKKMKVEIAKFKDGYYYVVDGVKQNKVEQEITNPSYFDYEALNRHY